MMTLNGYYRHFIQQLQHIYPAGETAAIASIIFENKIQVSRSTIIQSPEKMLTLQQQHLLDEALAQLLQHKPVQYITGETIFYGLTLKVNESVLIPRPETEELVQWILADHLNNSIHLLDIGTGSGCIPIAVKKNRPLFNVTAVDISGDALETAKQNARLHEAAIDFLQLDFLDTASRQQLPQFDIIVSNPPYIPINEKEKLDVNVTAFEPHEALFVPANAPLLFYEHLAQFAQQHLKQGGTIYAELHEDFADDTAALFSATFKTVELKQDISGKNRMIKASDPVSAVE